MSDKISSVLLTDGTTEGTMYGPVDRLAKMVRPEAVVHATTEVLGKDPCGLCILEVHEKCRGYSSVTQECTCSCPKPEE